MNERVLILGAGVYQVPLIQRAKERGHWVAVASWSGQDPGMGFADDCWVVNTTDKEQLLQRVREKKIAAVATAGTDVAVPSIGYLCDHLGLAGVTYETAVKCAYKIRMKESFAAAGVPTAAFSKIRSLKEANEAVRLFGLPVIVKAPESSGSRGITIVEEMETLPRAFECAFQVARTGEVILERLLRGIEYGAQVIVVNNQVVATFCHNDTVTPPPIQVPIGHSTPCSLSPEIQRETERVCALAVRSLGVSNGVCNCDLGVGPDGVSVLEIGARVGATGLAEIIELSYEVNLYDVVLDLALGREPKTKTSAQRAAAIVIIRAPASGRLRRCHCPDEIRSRPDVVSVNFDYAEGYIVKKFSTGPDRIGSVLVVGPTATEAERLATSVVTSLDIQVAPIDP